MLIRALALTAGLAVASVALLAWRIPASRNAPGTDVAFVADGGGELRLTPPGRFGLAHDLRPGGPAARATLRVANAADRPLEVTVTARRGPDRASRALRVRVTPARLRLSRRGSARVAVSARLSPRAGGDLRARQGTVKLSLRGRAR
jgi:hypothetical protein